MNIYVNEMFIKPIWGPDVWENHMQEKKEKFRFDAINSNKCMFIL